MKTKKKKKKKKKRWIQKMDTEDKTPAVRQVCASRLRGYLKPALAVKVAGANKGCDFT